MQAMESRVEWMWLGAEVTLDNEALTEYSGLGVCREVRLWVDTAARYKEGMRTWSRSEKIGDWRLNMEESTTCAFITFERVQIFRQP